MSRLKKKQRIRLVFLSIFLLAVSVALVAYGFRDGIAYFRSPAEIAEDPPADGETFRVGGLVVEGTLTQAGQTGVTFDLTDGEASISVLYPGILPDLFAEGQGAIALGMMRNGVFVANEILAKHDEKYMPKELADALRERGLFKPSGN